jgi:hypothetical protein
MTAKTPSASSGVADIEYTYGSGTEFKPVIGDWNNDGTDTAGLFKPSNGEWFLKNANTTGGADLEFSFGGGSGSYPIAGRWNGTGDSTVGVFR